MKIIILIKKQMKIYGIKLKFYMIGRNNNNIKKIAYSSKEQLKMKLIAKFD